MANCGYYCFKPPLSMKLYLKNEVKKASIGKIGISLLHLPYLKLLLLIGKSSKLHYKSLKLFNHMERTLLKLF